MDIFKICLKTISIAAVLIASVQVQADGGENSGGGNGIATYMHGMPYTPENIVKVESLALFKARQTEHRKWIEKIVMPKPNDSVNSEVFVQNHLQNIINRVLDRSPELGRLLIYANTQLSTQLVVQKQVQEKIKELPEISNIFDFGITPTLSENQGIVQIIRRKVGTFDIDLTLVNKMSALDKLDLYLHEIAYAVSFDKNSIRIQKFQLEMLREEFSDGPLSKEAFLAKNQTEWGFAQALALSENYSLGGLTLTQDPRPYRVITLANIPELPLAENGKLCGVATNMNYDKGTFTLIYANIDSQKEGKKQVKLSKKRTANLKKLHADALARLQSQVNPLLNPVIFEAPPSICLSKVLRSITYAEFRLFENSEAVKKAVENSAGLAVQRVLAPLYRSFDNSDSLYKQINSEASNVEAVESEIEKLYDERMKVIRISESMCGGDTQYECRASIEPWAQFSKSDRTNNLIALYKYAETRLGYTEGSHYGNKAALLELGRARRNFFRRSEELHSEAANVRIRTPDEVFLNYDANEFYRTIVTVAFKGKL